jgi:hypothetical protein
MPAVAVAGAVAVEAVTFTSVLAVTAVVALALVMLLFAGFVSTTCCWSTAIVPVTEKAWLDGLVQVTDQEAGLPGTVTAEETANEVFCTTCGFVDEVVHPGGSVSERVVSTFTGPYGPLL